MVNELSEDKILRMCDMIEEFNEHSLRRVYSNAESIRVDKDYIRFGLLNDDNNSLEINYYHFTCKESDKICYEVINDAIGRNINPNNIINKARGIGFDIDNRQIIIQGYDENNRYHTLRYTYQY